MRRLGLHKVATSTCGVAIALLSLAVNAQQNSALPPFDLQETTIGSIREAVATKKVSCEAIVKAYLERIERFDKSGAMPINAIITTNPSVIAQAKKIDALPATALGPLACAPLIIKDNIDVAGLPTTSGNKSLAHNIAKEDATQVGRLVSAGALVLAKSNLAEFAWTPDYSESAVGGLTRNPYDTQRTTGGSSGGTAAAVAANFGVAGLGTDTGASIRGPSALQNLVGLRPTMGASSRDGVIPIWLSRDTVGPMARTVTDAALIFEVTAGYDPKDAVTAAAQTHPAFSASHALRPGGLKGLRIGIFNPLVNRQGGNQQILQRFDQAISDLRQQGAIVVPLDISDFHSVADVGFPNRMEYDFNQYLLGNGVLSTDLNFAKIIDKVDYLPKSASWIKAQIGVPVPQNDPKERQDEEKTATLRSTIVQAMDRENLALVIYPTWMQPPRLLNQLSTDGGNNNSVFADAGLPAITVPMGDVSSGLPSGLQFGGRPFSEQLLISAAFGYEQATHHRRAPHALPDANVVR